MADKIDNEIVQHEHIVITNAETVRMMSDPMRIRIVGALNEPHTVKELATLFDVPVTRLYYHINLMEEHGMIQVVDTQIISGLIEKRYQAIARTFGIDGHLFNSDPKIHRRVDEIVGALFDNVRRQLRLLITKRQEESDKAVHSERDNQEESIREDCSPENMITLNYSVLALSPTEAKEFEAELDALVDRYDPDRNSLSQDAKPYSFTALFFPDVETEEISKAAEESV